MLSISHNSVDIGIVEAELSEISKLNMNTYANQCIK